MKRTAALILCFLMIFSLVSCAAGNSSEDTGTSTTPVASDIDGAKVIMKLGNTEVTFSEFNLYFHSIPASIINSYQQYFGDDYATYLIEQEKFDPNSSYKDQPCPYFDGSYYDYFLDTTKNYFMEIAALCTFAEENGIELTDEEKGNNDSEIKNILDYAAQSSSTLSEYYSDPLGITTEETVRGLYNKMSLANKATEAYTNSITLTDEEIDAEFAANPNNYSVVNYLAFTMQSNGETVADEDVKKYADELAATTTADEFKAYAKNFYDNVLNADTDDESDFDPASLEQKNVRYSEGLDALEWLFNEASVGECYEAFSEEDTICTVYMLTSAPKLNDYYTKNVRHILFNLTNYSSDDECKSKAETVYKEYLLNPTEDNFAALANKYSEDPDLEYDDSGNATGQKEEKTSGGLYENIEIGKMVTEFENWCFDPVRQSGDTGIIKSTHGYHIMYFVGDGNKIETGTEAIKSALLRRAFEEYRDSFDLTFDEEFVIENLD